MCRPFSLGTGLASVSTVHLKTGSGQATHRDPGLYQRDHVGLRPVPGFSVLPDGAAPSWPRGTGWIGLPRALCLTAEGLLLVLHVGPATPASSAGSGSWLLSGSQVLPWPLRPSARTFGGILGSGCEVGTQDAH